MVHALVRCFVAILLLAGPVLCMSGLLEHACTDCPPKATCGHEEDCAQDPCSEIALRPGSSTEGLDATFLLVAAPVILSHQPEPASTSLVDPQSTHPGATLSHSLRTGALPLLI